MNHFIDHKISFEKELEQTVNEKTEKHSRRIQCPECGRKTKTHIYEDITLLRFPLYCSKCSKEFIVDVMKFNMIISAEPDA